MIIIRKNEIWMEKYLMQTDGRNIDKRKSKKKKMEKKRWTKNN